MVGRGAEGTRTQVMRELQVEQRHLWKPELQHRVQPNWSNASRKGSLSFEKLNRARSQGASEDPPRSLNFSPRAGGSHQRFFSSKTRDWEEEGCDRMSGFEK